MRSRARAVTTTTVKRRNSDPIVRARPLLGTFVSISVRGLPGADAHRAIDLGFAAIAEIHRLMSFQERESDVSRLNLCALRGPVDVDPHTMHVIRRALELSEASGGSFDITVAAQLVAAGRLPAPESTGRTPDPTASWRDVELLDTDRVRFHRPLWIDLGGIAKGYAVDQAIARVPLEAGAGAVVNAGGDLRVAGPDAELVVLTAGTPERTAPVVRLQDGSLASSSGRPDDRIRAPGAEAALNASTHIDGRTRLPMGEQSFVSVVAPQCLMADALTKVVMAQGAAADAMLRRYEAGAWLYEERSGWGALGLAE